MPRAARASAAVARAVFGAAAARLRCGRACRTGRRRRRGTGRPGDGPAPAGRVLRPARRDRPDRLRRVLHDRRLGRRGPGRPPHRARRARGRLVPASLQRLRGLSSAAGRPTTADGADARRNISHHYDLSNDLFALFLDETLTYSSALFDTERRTGPPSRRAPRRRRRAARSSGCSTRPGSGRHPGARDRHRLGRARHPGRPPRRDRAHRSPSRRAAGAGRAADRRGRARRPGDRRAERLPRRRGPVRRGLLGRDDRGGRRAVLARLLPALDRVLAPGGRVAIQAITMPHDRMLATRHT